MHHNTSSVPDRFTNAATCDGIAVEVGLLPSSDDELWESQGGKGSDEECVPSKRWVVSIDGIINRAKSWICAACENVRTVVGDEMFPHGEELSRT